MDLPLTRQHLDNLLVEADDMDNHSPWCRHMPNDEIIAEVFRYAKENDSNFSCMAFFYDDGCDFNVAEVSLSYDSDTGFQAYLTINYSEDSGFDLDSGDVYKIDLDSVPLKTYGDFELYDFDEIINRGIELFNTNFDLERYQVV